MLVCKECGSELERISNEHLRKCCGLTIKEYVEKHGLDLAELILPSTSQRNEVPSELKSIGEVTSFKQLEDLTHDEKQVIFGLLLGNSCLRRDNGRAFLECQCGIDEFNYLVWKSYKLKRFEPKIFQRLVYSKVAQRIITQQFLRTKSTYLFGNALYDLFYVGQEKVISEKVLAETDALGLAVWYMDVGHLLGDVPEFRVQYLKDDNLKQIQAWFYERWKVESELSEDRKIVVKDVDKFFTIVKPYILPFFKYKVGYAPVEMEVAKTVRFRAAHHLENHDGKCYQEHGEHLVLEVAVKGPVNPVTGMVMDFGYIKQVIKKYIINVLDHKHLNKTVPELRHVATSERLLVWIWQVLVECIPGLYRLTLYEGPQSTATFYGPSRTDLEGRKQLDDFLKWEKVTWDEMIANYPELKEYRVVYDL